MTLQRFLGKVSSPIFRESPVSDPFAAIRPYDDAEVRPTIDRLLKSRDFLNALLRLRLGDGALRFGWLLRPLARRYLRSQLAPVQGVMDLQMRIKPYIERMIQETTAGFSVSGLEQLDREPCLPVHQ
jgi:hypothetical protein